MEYLYVSIGILVVINILVSLYLSKRDDLDRFQKNAQIIVVWIIPFVGAIALWVFHRSQEEVATQSKGPDIRSSHDYTTGGD